MKKFKNDEDGYSQWSAANPAAFVLNHFGGTDAHYNVLHKASCNFLHRACDDGVRTVVEKWGSDSAAEIVHYANDLLGLGNWNRCGVCFRPEVDSIFIGSPAVSSPRASGSEHATDIVVLGEPAAWIGAGEKEWKEKVTTALVGSPPAFKPQWLDVEFRFLDERMFVKDVDNLLTPILESARDAGWIKRGFAQLGSVTARKMCVNDAADVGVSIVPMCNPPALSHDRAGILLEAELPGLDAEAIKWTLYEKSLCIYQRRPEVRFPPLAPIALEIRVIVGNESRRKSLQALDETLH